MNVQDGTGYETWLDGAFFSGIYVNGKKEGEGNFTWGNGSYYKGNFKMNMLEG